jgi:hypothetical protein
MKRCVKPSCGWGSPGTGRNTGVPVLTLPTPEKIRRDCLLALAKTQPDWAVGCADEVWWSRQALPHRQAVAPRDHPLHLIERGVPDSDPHPKALACYGSSFRAADHVSSQADTLLLRFVDGRPSSAISHQFLHWVCQHLTHQGKRVAPLDLGQCLLACQQTGSCLDTRPQSCREALRPRYPHHRLPTP